MLDSSVKTLLSFYHYVFANSQLLTLSLSFSSERLQVSICSGYVGFCQSLTMSFDFSCASEFLFTAQYLAEFDDSLRFKLSNDGRCITLAMSTVDVPPFSFSTIEFNQVCETAPKMAALEPVSTTWTVNSGFLISVLRCFVAHDRIVLEVAEDLSCMHLYQRQEDGHRIHVAQVSVLHYLGANLSIHHDVGELYTIPDLRNLFHIVQSINSSEDHRCDILLQWDMHDKAKLIMQTTTVTSSLQLILERGKCSSQHFKGAVYCEDLGKFSFLCSHAAKKFPSVSVMVGFGSCGVVMFRLVWETEKGSQTATLFFCSG